MIILITGASAYIGTYLCEALSKTKHQVFGLYNNNQVEFPNIKLLHCDFEGDNVDNLFNSVRPDVVIHLASVTQTKTSRYGEEYVDFVNHLTTKRIARLCKKRGASLIYTSTDLVYGEGEGLKEDSAKLDPLTTYAKTKLLGEDAVRRHAPYWTILRTSLVYGFTKSTYRTFFDISYDALNKGEKFHAFTDQFRCPIFVEDVVKNLIQLAEGKSANETINFCGSEYLSRYEMCVKMAGVFGFDKELIVPSSCDEFKEYQMVKRIGLNNEKMKKFRLTTESFEENLKKIKESLPK